MVSSAYDAMFKLHTQFGLVTFFSCLTLLVCIRYRIFLVVITPISGLQDVSWIARWDRGMLIQLIENLLELNRGAPFHNHRFLSGFPRWCWGVDIIVTPIGGLQDMLWIARCDRSAVSRLILNLLDLNGGVSWLWGWFCGWFCRDLS